MMVNDCHSNTPVQLSLLGSFISSLLGCVLSLLLRFDSCLLSLQHFPSTLPSVSTVTVTMPTMTSKKLGDLEAERKSFILHEMRIIEERDEILKNLRAHLDQLDMEIVRLGGKARATTANQGRASASPKDDGYVPSITPFSPAKGASQAKKLSRGRPRKSEGGGSAAAENVGSQQKKAISSPKKMLSMHVLVSEKEKSSSNCSLSSPNDRDDPKKRQETQSKSNTAVAGIPKSEESKAAAGAGDGESKPPKKKRKRRSSVPIDPGEIVGEPWTCECGERMAAGRKRCGKCRRWKGGKRETRWSRKSVDSSATKKMAGMPKAIDVYRSVLPTALRPRDGLESDAVNDGAIVLTQLKAASDGAIALAQLKASNEGIIVPGEAAANDPRSAIESVLSQMVFAVAKVATLGQTKSKGSKKNGDGTKRRRKSSVKDVVEDAATSNGAKNGAKAKAGANSNKHEQGHPKKESDKTQLEIHQVVSTSDSDSNSTTEDSRKRDRPRENPVAKESEEPVVQNVDTVEQAPRQSHPGTDGAKGIATEESQTRVLTSMVPAAQIQDVTDGQLARVPNACMQS